MSTDAMGAPHAFPTTRPSIVEAMAAQDEDARRRALDTLVAVYWRPAYLHLRRKWGAPREDAEDLTQEFFARVASDGFLSGYDSGRARFRTFLRGCLDHLAANARRDAGRLKRGGAVAHLPLDFADAEGQVGLDASAAADPDRRFHQEWLRGLFTLAVDALRRESEAGGHQLRFRLFSRHDLEPPDDESRPSYRDLAAEFGLPVTQVTNHLAWARREFRRLVLDRLREVCADEAEFRAEARELFGVSAT